MCGNILAWRNDGLFTSSLSIIGGMLAVIGGCPPYNWKKLTQRKTFYWYSLWILKKEILLLMRFTVAVDSGACAVEVIVTDTL